MARAAAVKTAQAHLRFVMDRTAVQHVGHLRAPGALGRWKAEVDGASTAAELGACFSEYLQATALAPFTADMLAVRGALSEALAGGRHTPTQMAELIKKYRLDVITAGLQAVRQAAPKRRWCAAGGRAGKSAYATDARAIEESIRRPFDDRRRQDLAALEHSRQSSLTRPPQYSSSLVLDANGHALSWAVQERSDIGQLVPEVIRQAVGPTWRTSRVADRVGRELGLGAGYVTLCHGRLLAPKELAGLRACGKVGLSPSAPLVLASTSRGEVAALGWATDALVLPDSGMNCVLYSLAALLATSWAVLAPPSDILLTCKF